MRQTKLNSRLKEPFGQPITRLQQPAASSQPWPRCQATAHAQAGHCPGQAGHTGHDQPCKKGQPCAAQKQAVDSLHATNILLPTTTSMPP